MWAYRLDDHQEVGSFCTLFSSQKGYQAAEKAAKTHSFYGVITVCERICLLFKQCIRTQSQQTGTDRASNEQGLAGPVSLREQNPLPKFCKELSFFSSLYPWTFLRWDFEAKVPILDSQHANGCQEFCYSGSCYCPKVYFLHETYQQKPFQHLKIDFKLCEAFLWVSGSKCLFLYRNKSCLIIFIALGYVSWIKILYNRKRHSGTYTKLT